jgi:hypothetical protein
MRHFFGNSFFGFVCLLKTVAKLPLASPTANFAFVAFLVM